MTDYKTLLEGAKGLLGDCCRILEGIDLTYTIVGGWSPYLLNNKPIKHPGTHDVDLLFKDGGKEGMLEHVINKFKSEGFISSAKHHFQLLKTIQIKGTLFVYNVDLLHSSNNNGTEDMFVDHLNLPVPLSDNCSDTYKMISIKAPHSDSIFSEYLFESQKQSFILPDNGKQADFKFSLINEAGLIITKTSSVKQKKRPRDSFDIYVAIKQARDYQALVRKFQLIKTNNAELFNTLYGIKEAIAENDVVANVYRYACPDNSKWHMLNTISNDFNTFFTDIGLQEKAEHKY